MQYSYKGFRTLITGLNISFAHNVSLTPSHHHIQTKSATLPNKKKSQIQSIEIFARLHCLARVPYGGGGCRPDGTFVRLCRFHRIALSYEHRRHIE